MLTEAMNTYNIALYTIKEKGYAIRLEMDEAKAEITYRTASKKDMRISAFNPLSLLALVVVHEQYGAHWNQVSTGNLYDDILSDD
ncbi:hypothetical protein HGH92_17355 [Chitinophaga varians]|uniref:Uncharacterized protein n=1 Tax=Chitinophaga varians TaxID=2202339 RepID=A0A847RYW7_9BACT|nr:hypothetical protein [Chitinophaga varians]NLR66078.1 hypothetical protein [Chitinophaga varians]